MRARNMRLARLPSSLLEHNVLSYLTHVELCAAENASRHFNPADDYVEAFVKDVNRAKVIKAKIIMVPAAQANGIDKTNLIKVNEDQFIEEFLPQVVCNNANCEVVDRQGNTKGYITNKELQKSLSKS